MRFIYTIFITIVFSFLCSRLAAQENPFVRMAEMTYAEYCDQLAKSIYKDIDRRDSAWFAETTAQMREAARVSGNQKWNLEASLLEADYRYFRPIYLQKPDQQGINRMAGEMIARLTDIAEKAAKTGATDIQLRALHSIMQRYAVALKNYEMGFRSCHELDKVLSTVSAEEFPYRPDYYVEMALQYYSFREYETAKLYFEKVLESPEIAYRHRMLERTWNDLGVIYRNHYKDLAASDSCFRRIMELDPAHSGLVPPGTNEADLAIMHREYALWTAIANGNIGSNAFLRGDYDAAIAPLQFAVEKVVRGNHYNYPYAAGKAITLVDIFLEKNDFRQAELYAGKAWYFLDMSRKTDKVEGVVRDTQLWAEYYKTMTRYWRMQGNNAQALLYADSTLTMRTLFEADFNLRKLHRAEEQIKQEELEAEKLRSEAYRRLSFIIAGFLSVICVLLGLTYYYYRKKKTAYQDLVEKNKQWAGSDRLEKVTVSSLQASPAPEGYRDNGDNDDNGNNRQAPTEKEIELTARIHELMLSRQIYRDSTLTLDSLGQLLDVNRESVSRAINHTTGKNFSRFLNEYRIKESIRILSAAHNHTVNFDDLAERVGFNNRTTFHRAFKQITGLSPNEFKNKV